MPFHYGPANCVGRSLALHELRTVLSALVRRFDFSFAPGFEGSDWISQLKDQFILLRGELKVVMTERK
jgi:cytochrome P450